MNPNVSNMDGYLVIGIFIVILAFTLFWLQRRQTKKEAPESKRASLKTIQVVKARDWPIQNDDSESTVEETQVGEVVDLDSEDKGPSPVKEFNITQLNGVGPKYRLLLFEAGITTVNQIAESKPDELIELLNETNEREKITSRLPTMDNVELWIKDAKALLS